MIALSRGLKPFVAILAVLGVSLVLPLTTNIQPVAAKQMDHMSSNTQTACASYCSKLNTVTGQPPAALNEDEVQTPQPVPKPQESYYVQFQISAGLKVKPSAQSFVISVRRPPDIVALNNNYQL